jgi:hypothetical protein
MATKDPFEHEAVDFVSKSFTVHARALWLFLYREEIKQAPGTPKNA